MKQTEIGMIPDDWEVKELGTLARFQQGYQIFFADQTNYSIDGYIRYLYISDFFSNQNILYVKDSTNYYHITEKDICIANTGATCGKAFRGKIGLLSNNMFKVFLSQKLDCDYTWQYFNSLLYSKELSEHINGAGQPHVGHKNMALIKIPLPPTLAEQQKIAKALSDVDNVIYTLEKLITKKKNLKQGTMQQLLTGKKRLPGFAKSNKFKQTEIGEIPEDWKVKELGEVSTNYTGLTYSPENINEYGTLVLRSSNIQDDMLSFDDNVYVNMNIPERAIAHTGDILICVRNGSKRLIGKSALITESANNCAFGAFMTILRTELLNQQFLFYVWQSDIIQKQIEESMGATINQITNKDIRHYLIAYPKSNAEQIAIANVLSSMDKEIEALEAKLGKYRDLKTGMMQQLLTGKIRLV